MAAKVTYHGGEAKVSTVEELDAVVTRAHEEALKRPSMIELVLDSGDAMAMGLGREVTVLSFVPHTLEPPYFASLGDVSAEGFIDFAYAGQFSEFPRSQAIPVDVGREALRGFFATGNLPQVVAWQEV